MSALGNTASRGLQGRRILLVEDDMLIAMMLDEFLRQLGCEPVGPAARLTRAVELAAGAAIDGAVLDLNVNGEPVYPVAAELARRGIPFVFVTGYSAAHVSEAYRDRPLLRKPFESEEFGRTLGDLFA